MRPTTALRRLIAGTRSWSRRASTTASPRGSCSAPASPPSTRRAAASRAAWAIPTSGSSASTEVVERLSVIVEHAGVPVIADADTGYGNALNVRRTVREFERAGVAAFHLEDQTFPKRCGHLDDKTVVPTAEMVQKLRAARDARPTPISS